MGHDATKRCAFGWSADPPELAAIEPDGFIAKRLTQHIGAIPDADEQAIRLGAVKGIVRRDQTTGAGHVLDNDGRMTRDMFADMSPDDSRREIVAAAGRESDHKPDGLAFVKIIRSGMRQTGETQKRHTEYYRDRDVSFHGFGLLCLLPAFRACLFSRDSPGENRLSERTINSEPLFFAHRVRAVEFGEKTALLKIIDES